MNFMHQVFLADLGNTPYSSRSPTYTFLQAHPFYYPPLFIVFQRKHQRLLLLYPPYLSFSRSYDESILKYCGFTNVGN